MTGARVLVACTGFKSNLFSSIALGIRLRDAGHDVVFLAPADAARWIDHCGFEHIICPHPKTGVATAYDAPLSGRARSPRTWSDRVRAGLGSVRDEGFDDVLETIKPDVVLADCEHHTAIIQTTAHGYPLGLLSFMYLTPPGGQRPPLNSAILPGAGWRGSSPAIWLNWFRLWLQTARWRARTAWTFFGAQSEAVHRALARDLGVSLGSMVTRRAFQAPWSYRLPTLFLLSPDVDFPGELWPGQVFAGPMVLRDRPKDDMLSECAQFLAPGAERRIYVSFGTVRRSPLHLFENLIEVARRNPTWRFLLAGSQHDEVTGLDLPENFASVPWANQTAMLEAADCALFHGGAGTLNECIVTRTPMIVYPNGLDGGGNGARIEYQGLGKLASSSHSSAKIEADLLQVFSDPSIKQAVDRIASEPSSAQPVLQAFLDGLIREHGILGRGGDRTA